LDSKEGIEVEVELDDDEQHESLYHDFKTSSVKPSMDNLSVPHSPLMSESIPQALSETESLEVTTGAGEEDYNVANLNFNRTPTVRVAEKSGSFGYTSPKVGVEPQQDSFGFQVTSSE
jgi:hypothetical protein